MNLEQQSDIVYKTMCARFTAYRRMKRNRDASKGAESLFSASIIALGLISMTGDKLDLSNNISAFTIILSTFLLVLSLLFGGLNYEKRMENYHSCGNELNHLYRLMMCESQCLSEERQKEKALEYLKQYHTILTKYNLNHTTFDYEYAMSALSTEQIAPLSKFWLKMRYYLLDVYMLYWLIALVPIACIGWYYFSKLMC